jgi:probable rRNA maturation factor
MLQGKIMKRKSKFSVNILLEKKKFLCSFDIRDLKKRMIFILSLINENSAEVSFRFCDENEMKMTNMQFRGKDYPTDVLSFPNANEQISISESHEPICYLGDILICIPVCINQAKKAKISLDQELEKMMIHGLVHLKGFDHERNDSAWLVMSGLEKLLQKELIQQMGKPKWTTLR